VEQEQCPPGYRCSGTSQERCENKISNPTTGKCVSCESDEFADPASNTCRACPRVSPDQEAICGEGSLTLADGFVSSSTPLNGTRGEQGVTSATVFTACPCKDCCSVSFYSELNSTTATQCRLNTRGTLCAICRGGYHHQSARDPCVACPGSGFAGFLKRQTELFVVLGALATLVAVDACFGWRWRRLLEQCLPRVWHRLISKTKILVNFMQLVTLFSPVYRIRFPPAFVSFLSAFSFFNLDLFRWLPVGCFLDGFNFYDELTVSTVCFLALAATVTLVHAIKAKAGKTSCIGRWTDTLAGAALVCTYAVYPSLAVKIFSTFNCGTVKHAGGTAQFLRADYSIDCGDGAHWGYQIYAGFMVLAIAIGTPVTYLVLLWKSRRAETHMDAVDSAEHLLFLSQDYTQDCWYWEAVESGRKLWLTGFAVFVAQGSLLQLVLSFLMSAAYLVCVIKMRPYRGTAYANVYAILVNALVVAVLFVSVLLEVDRSLTLALSNDPGLKWQLLRWDSDDLGYVLTALVSTAIGSWAVFIAYDFDDTRDAKLLEKYVPPKDLQPGSKATQLQLLELESKLDRGELQELPRAAMDACFAKVRNVLDAAVANGKTDRVQLHAVQRLAGAEHKHAYAACHEIVAIEAGHADLLASTRAAALQHAGVGGGVRTCKQQSGDLCTLYKQAREVLPAFQKQISAFVAQFNALPYLTATRFNGSQRAAGPTVKLHTSPLKHLYRCMEKMCLKGGAQRYTCFNICDINRCIMECDGCEAMAAVLQALLANRATRVIRVKDRANHLTTMNWMDVMVNLVLVADGHVHVCEIQIVHTKMMLARKGLGGHKPYAQARAASEIVAARAGAPGTKPTDKPLHRTVAPAGLSRGAAASKQGGPDSWAGFPRASSAVPTAQNPMELSAAAKAHLMQIYGKAVPVVCLMSAARSVGVMEAASDSGSGAAAAAVPQRGGPGMLLPKPPSSRFAMTNPMQLTAAASAHLTRSFGHAIPVEQVLQAATTAADLMQGLASAGGGGTAAAEPVPSSASLIEARNRMGSTDSWKDLGVAMVPETLGSCSTGGRESGRGLAKGGTGKQLKKTETAIVHGDDNGAGAWL
jgi:hypothetical protein